MMLRRENSKRLNGKMLPELKLMEDWASEGSAQNERSLLNEAWL
jgi:hypothetical protein